MFTHGVCDGFAFKHLCGGVSDSLYLHTLLMFLMVLYSHTYLVVVFLIEDIVLSPPPMSTSICMLLAW